MTAGEMTRAALSPLRRDRITASRLSVVLGLSPYLTPNALMRQMVREHFGDPDEFVGNPAVDWGNRHEEVAGAEYELIRGVEVWCSGARQRALVHPVFDFLATTPDGVTPDRIVEVKAAMGWWRGTAWPAHLERVASNPAYAAAAAAILAGMLGLLPFREVIAAVLTAVISALLREGARGEGPWSHRVDPRDFA